jgi:hypothetical protein
MKRIIAVITLMGLNSFVWAEDNKPSLVLDKIVFQTSAKQWVTTETALLSVSINVALSNADLVKARAEVMASLNKIAKGEWHLVQFDRSQDNSGLEKLYVLAQVRVNQSALTDIYQNAKSVSKPGAQYTVNNVEFKPSLEEVQGVKVAIRKQLYQQISDELTRMNQVYPTQSYSVSNVVFIEGSLPPQPMPVPYEKMMMNTMAMGQALSAPLAVSNELVLTAQVEAASNRKG